MTETTDETETARATLYRCPAHGWTSQRGFSAQVIAALDRICTAERSADDPIQNGGPCCLKANPLAVVDTTIDEDGQHVMKDADVVSRISHRVYDLLGEGELLVLEPLKHIVREELSADHEITITVEIRQREEG